MEENEKKNPGCLKWGLFGIVVFCVLTILGGIFSGGDEPATEEETTESNTSEQTQTEEKAEWEFETRVDEMTDTKNVWARIVSDNYIEQKFPYEGETYATLTVRYTKKDGYNVLFRITQGQIVGIDVQGTDYITARFDQNQPKKYYFVRPEDHSTETVFVKNAQDFIKQCKTAKDIKIDVPLYQAGRPVFSFHVDEPLTWPEE